MKYNHIIHILKAWCHQKGEQYRQEYEKAKGITYIRYLATDELSFQLSMLTDKEFSSDEEFQNSVIALLNTHYDISLTHLESPVAKYMVEQIHTLFCEYMHTVFTSDIKAVSSGDPYERVIVGEEANEIISRFQSFWEYRSESYWFPLCGNEPEQIKDKFFVMFEYAEPHWDEIGRLIGLPHNHIYSYGESVHQLTFCIETDQIDALCYSEWAYTDKSFTWIIYFSHEGTVAFAGSIVPQIKELLKDKQAHWNRYEG